MTKEQIEEMSELINAFGHALSHGYERMAHIIEEVAMAKKKSNAPIERPEGWEIIGYPQNSQEAPRKNKSINP